MVDLLIDTIYERCATNAPNYAVTKETFRVSIDKTLVKFRNALPESPPTDSELTSFIEQLQCDDLYMTIACSDGNESAWWDFDHQHRSYMERVARHLAKTEMDATDIVDTVYEQLYGTRVVDGERISKFSTYSGRGSLRGWLRTVIWHSLVDLHRASHDEISLDEMTETVGEGVAHASFAEEAPGGEDEMIEHITRQRFKKATTESLNTAFSTLEDHEKLLLFYYHANSLKLREIARLVENEDSPLRAAFQRRSQTRDKNPGGRIHESTVMRWLEKSYAKVLEIFREELKTTHSLTAKEIDVCLSLATEDLTSADIYKNLQAS